MLSQFDRRLLDAVVRLTNDNDFKLLVEFIKSSVTTLALSSVRHTGEEGDKLKGACEAFQEIRDLIATAHHVQSRFIENEETEAIQSRDYISP